MKTLLLETERRSFSVTDRIEAGDVEVVDIEKFEQMEKVVWEIYKKKKAYDVVVLDTLDSFAQRARLELGTENVGEVAIWANKTKLKTSQPDWGLLNDSILRLILLLRDSPTMLIIVSHEATREVDNGAYERRAPNLNAGLLNGVIPNCDIVLRLSRPGKAGEFQGRPYQAQTPIARLIEDGKCMAAASTTGRNVVVPELIIDPTLAKLRDAVGGKLPGTICIYGTKGSGKTTLACTGYTLNTTTKKETT